MKASCPGGPGAKALLTDLYQLTMAYGYWKAGQAEREAVFHLSFRKQPFQGGFTIGCGLADCARYLLGFKFEKSDLEYLGQLKGNDGRGMFEAAFLKYLGGLRLGLDVDAMPEGTAVFPQEPLVRVRGALLQAQLVETALLNLVNFQSLIATKAARVCLAAQGDLVVEFGLRRAHGVDGALTASRAAYVGGCAGTSNVLAGKVFGIPVQGTQAHIVTAYDQPALGGVYKLSAMRKPDGTWDHKIKLSEQAAKVTNPGVLQVRRFREKNEFVGDAIYDQTRPLPKIMTMIDPMDATRRKHFPEHAQHEDLLVPVLRRGQLVHELPSLEAIRARAQRQLAMLHPGIKRFDNPHQYPAGLESTLHEFKTDLILRAKGEI